MNLLATYIATSLASVPWTAERVAEKAVERSPEIMAAAAERRSAGASTEAAESLLLPRVQLSARYTRLSRIENDPLVALGVDFDAARANVAGISDVNTRDALKQQIGILEGLDGVTIGVPTDQYSLNASVTLPISQVLFEALPALQAAKRGEEASDLEIAAARHAVALGAVEAYYQHFLAQRALRIAELSVASATTAEAQARSRVAEGLSTEADLLRFVARRAEASRLLAARQADVDRSAAAVRVLAGIGGAGPLPLAPLPTVPREMAASAEEAIQRRPELRALRKVLASQRARARAFEGGVLPQLSASFEVISADPNPNFVPPPDGFDTNWQATALLSWSPDGAWRASRNGTAAWREADALAARVEALEDAVRIEVASEAAGMRAAQARVLAAEEGVEAAREGWASISRGFELGVFDATDLIEAQLELERARLARIDARVARRISAARLWTALGHSVLNP